MEIISSFLNGAHLIKGAPIGDSRGSFQRLYCQKELSMIGVKPIVQMNFSISTETGTLRGMHYQSPPMAEQKLVRCMEGRAYDVIVDLRRNSPTYLQWHAVELSPENHHMIFVPEGFAHGFQTLASDTKLLYFHTEYYSPTHECGVNHADPLLNITWALPPCNLSQRDKSFDLIDGGFKGIL